ncbi:MAG: hypothetical protein M3313_09360 [Actinomycetota bacterium]|nr:hypothetical protein [Actinomycetota bacterium]
MTRPAMRPPSVRRPSMPRLLLGLGGGGLLGIGLFNLLALGFHDLLWVGFWLGLGLVAHDGVLAPATAGLSKLAADRWPAHRRRVLLVAVVCIGTLTLLALPLVIQRDAVAGNDTLLGRNYLLGWAAACLLVVIGAGTAEVLGRMRSNRVPPRSTVPPTSTAAR